MFTFDDVLRYLGYDHKIIFSGMVVSITCEITTPMDRIFEITPMGINHFSIN